MIRVSSCKYFVAALYKSSVCIQKTEAFLNVYGITKSVKKEFSLFDGRRYTYLEWPPLNNYYIESIKDLFILLYIEIDPCFLTLDDKGTLRIHYVKEGTEEIIQEGEFFRCGTI